MPYTPPITLPDDQLQLACDDQVGNLNNTANGNTPPESTTGNTGSSSGGTTYVPPTLCVGTWEISTTNPDACATNEQLNQQAYVAESLNISGAPINVYPLLGVHQQGNGSILTNGTLISSASAPGYPLTGVNGGPGWRSVQTATSVAGNAYIGIDFGIKLLTAFPTQSEYQPDAQKWTDVGAVAITQSNNPGFFATQVRVDTTNGDVKLDAPILTGLGNGTLINPSPGSNATQCIIIAQAVSSTLFTVYAQLPSGTVINLGTATVGLPFYSVFLNFTISIGTIPFSAGDMFSVNVNYIWYRAGIFNIIQSPLAQTLNLGTVLKVKAIKVVPTMFAGSGNWEVDAIDFLDAPPPAINVIQDLFFNENRDRDYSNFPVQLKCAYTPVDSINDLSKFGLNILDQYVFTVAFATMVQKLSRPIIVGDIIEVIPELQWGQDLKPVRKFLEVADASWASSGFGPGYNPTVYRFTAQQALPSQETRDIFGTIDTQKYLVADSIFANNIGKQIDTTPLTRTEEISKLAANTVPEIGSDDIRSVEGIPILQAGPPRNPRGNPAAETNPSPSSHPNLYIEAGLPPNGESYGEGFKLPVIPGPSDGDYFRLYYPSETKIPPRLYRFSAVKNAWIFKETDRRTEYTSAKPSVHNLMQSSTRISLNKKLT